MKLNYSNRMQIALFAMVIVLLSGAAHGERPVTHISIARGEAITGANRLLGDPIYSYDFAPNPTFGFNTVDEYDPGGGVPKPLSPNSHPDAILATTFPNLAAVPGPVLPNINIPLRDVGTYINGLLDRAPVPFQLNY